MPTSSPPEQRDALLRMRFLVDEMFPAATASALVQRGHDAVHVRQRGLDARPDREVAVLAAREDRVLVTENVKDFAAERDIVVACVLKSTLPARGMGEHLAVALDDWARAERDPYVGLHWPLARGR